MESVSCGRVLDLRVGVGLRPLKNLWYLFFVLLTHATVWLLFNRPLAFLFSLFTSSESLTGPYTEDEPRGDGWLLIACTHGCIVKHYFIPLSCSTDRCEHLSNRHNFLARAFSSSSFVKAPGRKVGISNQEIFWAIVTWSILCHSNRPLSIYQYRMWPIRCLLMFRYGIGEERVNFGIFRSLLSLITWEKIYFFNRYEFFFRRGRSLPLGSHSWSIVAFTSKAM